MRISDLIKKLESLKEKHGDNILIFDVKDYYSIYGEAMTTGLKCGEETGFPSDWSDVRTSEGYSKITFHLDPSYGKQPKITFRKPS